MDIYERLIEDHEKQRGLGRALAATSGDSEDRRRLFDAFRKEVEAHAAAEEQTFYAELIAHDDGQEQARHSVAEHKDAADLIEELEETDMSSSAWLMRFRELHDELVHHLDEEEEEVFPKAKKLISKKRAAELGDDFARIKDDHMAELKAA